MKVLLTLMAFTLVTVTAFAKGGDGESLSIKKGTQINVLSYDAAKDVFTVGIESEPGVGPNYTNARYLQAAIELEGTRDQFIRNRDQVIGTIYTLKKPLRLISELEVEGRPKAGSR